MATLEDYLNLTEIRELSEITADLASLRRVRSELNARKAKIKARAAKRLECANIRLRRLADDSAREVIG